MFNTFDHLTGSSAPRDGSAPASDSASDLTARRKTMHVHGPTFSKIFRWRHSDPHAPIPVSVELAGSFTDWRAVPLMRDAVTNTWQITLHGIAANHTHRYMVLANGEPAYDKNCDGLAIPQNAEEQQYQLMTARGPRVFLLFAQTK